MFNLNEALHELAADLDEKCLYDMDEFTIRIVNLLADAGYGRIVNGYNWSSSILTQFFEAY